MLDTVLCIRLNPMKNIFGGQKEIECWQFHMVQLNTFSSLIPTMALRVGGSMPIFTDEKTEAQNH